MTEAMRSMQPRGYAALSWGAIALGLLHTAATSRMMSPLTQASLWFASAGLLMMLVGMVNLLNRRYGASARGLRRVTIGVNIVILAFAVTTGLLGKKTGALDWVVVLGIFGGMLALSTQRRALL